MFFFRTPLHILSERGYLEIAKELLTYGASTEAKTNKNWTPLHFASKNGQSDVVVELLANNAYYEAREDSNWYVYISRNIPM